MKTVLLMIVAAGGTIGFLHLRDEVQKDKAKTRAHAEAMVREMRGLPAATPIAKAPPPPVLSPRSEPPAGYHYERSQANGQLVPVRDGSSWRRSVGGG